MSDQQIINELVTALNEILNATYGITAESTDKVVTKNNDTPMRGIIIREQGSNIAATMYIDDAIKDIREGNVSAYEAAEKIAARYNRELSYQQEMKSQISTINFKTGQKNLFCEVINYASNKQLLEDVPHRRIEDLAIIARYRVSSEASFIVHHNAAEKMNMNSDEIIERAIINSIKTGFKVQSLQSVLSDLMGPMDMTTPFPSASPEMYVISNDDKYYGAAGIYIDSKLREEVRDAIGGDAIILPSSIHECLAIRDEGQDITALQALVKEINSTEVAPEEVLSDNIYRIDQTLNIKQFTNEDRSLKDANIVNDNMRQHRAFAM